MREEKIEEEEGLVLSAQPVPLLCVSEAWGLGKTPRESGTGSEAGLEPDHSLTILHTFITKFWERPKCSLTGEYGQMVVCSCYGKLFNSKNKEAPGTCKYMNTSQKYNFEQKKPYMKESIPYDSIYTSF